MPRLDWPVYDREDGRARMNEPEPTLAERLVALMDHLGITSAYMAAQMAGDVVGLVEAAPDRIAGLVLCVPSRLDPPALAPVADRLLLIGAEHGLSAAVTARGAMMLPGAAREVLQGYDAPGWADVMADHGDSVVRAIERTPNWRDAPIPTELSGRSGVHAGISWRASGQGPVLLLFPFFLAPSQWFPALDALAGLFTTILVGGRHVGGVAALEDRARSPSYVSMVETLFERLGVGACQTVLDVGCGSGALDRLLASRHAPRAAVTATDVNAFMLAEAASIATGEGLADRIIFREGNAEVLPFPDATFDCAFSVTVLEECDADRALAEMMRVVRPGGRVGVIVRAIDLPQFWHLDLPEAMRRKVNTPPQSVGALGVADASLYRRMRRAGFETVRGFPALVTLNDPLGPIWRFREDHALSLLDAEETVTWRRLSDAARRDGSLFQSHAMHCAVGTRPAQPGAAGLG